jgi:A/G-specific adenine glycosylase
VKDLGGTDLNTIKENMPQLVHTLVTWYLANQRPMPWRQSSDPYAIWISETMLQQTQVDTVIPYYQRFMTAFPTVFALALASETDVLNYWQGLGYYSRARNLHRAAQIVAQDHDGNVPADAEAFRRLPGVGPYTTGAVQSIAFNQPVPAIDGNVLRVFSRFRGIPDAVESTSAKRLIYTEIEQWMTVSEPRHLTQALMELGAVVCKPRNPNCADCPIQSGCFAKAHNQVNHLPIRRKRAARKQAEVAALWLTKEDAIMLEQRAGEGLLANMWQLPAIEVTKNTNSVADLDLLPSIQLSGIIWRLTGDEVAGNRVAEAPPMEFVEVAQEKHVFTHLEWRVRVFHPMGLQVFLDPLPGNYTWVGMNELEKYPLPRVYEKLIEQLVND